MIEKQNTWTKKQMAVSVVVLVALICMLVFVLQQPEITGFRRRKQLYTGIKSHGK